MKCSAVHTWLLGCETPDRAPADVTAHLAGCRTCRAWQRRLIRLERGLKLLPVSASDAKTKFVHDFIGGMPVGEELDSIREWNAEEDAREVLASTGNEIASEPTLIDGWKLSAVRAAIRAALEAPSAKLHQVPAPARRRVAMVLAAALLLFAFTFWSAGPNSPFSAPPPGPKPGPDPFLARLVQHEVKLAAATEPKVKMQVLADMADDLQETQNLAEAANIDSLERMAKLYKKVADRMLKQAESVPPEERDLVLPAIADRLSQAYEKAHRLIDLAPTARQREPLIEISSAADENKKKIHGLLGRKL